MAMLLQERKLSAKSQNAIKKAQRELGMEGWAGKGKLLEPQEVNYWLLAIGDWAHAGNEVFNLVKPWPPSGDTHVYSKNIDDASLAPLTARERSVLDIAWTTIQKDAW